MDRYIDRQICRGMLAFKLVIPTTHILGSKHIDQVQQYVHYQNMYYFNGENDNKLGLSM